MLHYITTDDWWLLTSTPFLSPYHPHVPLLTNTFLSFLRKYTTISSTIMWCKNCKCSLSRRKRNSSFALWRDPARYPTTYQQPTDYPVHSFMLFINSFLFLFLLILLILLLLLLLLLLPLSFMKGQPTKHQRLKKPNQRAVREVTAAHQRQCRHLQTSVRRFCHGGGGYMVRPETMESFSHSRHRYGDQIAVVFGGSYASIQRSTVCQPNPYS